MSAEEKALQQVMENPHVKAFVEAHVKHDLEGTFESYQKLDAPTKREFYKLFETKQIFYFELLELIDNAANAAKK